MGSIDEAEIYDELENKLGRSATYDEFNRVVERLPEFYSQTQLRRVVARLIVDNRFSGVS